MKLSTKIFLPIILISALLISLTGCFGVPADDSPGFTPGSIKGTMTRPEVCCGEPSESSLVGDAISPNVCDDLTLCDPQHMADWYAWANVKVTLTNWVDCEEVELASTMTDENGNYLFENVPAGKNYIITAICPEEIDFKVKDVAEEVVAGSSYNAGIADAESTVLALCLEGLGEICLDSDVLSLNDFRDHFKYDKVICEVCDQLAECSYALPVWVCEITELCPGYTSTGGGGDDDDDDPVTYNLTMLVSPTGGGTTNPSVGGSPHNYPKGKVVTLTATAAACYEFVGWTGDVTSSDNPTSVTMNGNKTVTANFEPFQGPTANAGGPYSDEVCPEKDSTISFNGTASGTGTLTYAWDFGDGGTSDLEDPSHTYLNPFTGSPYTVILTVTDDCGSTTDKTTVTIKESDPLKVDAGGPYNETVCPGTAATIAFDSTIISGTGPFTYAWDFGDGGTSDLEDPSHTYPVGADEYKVTLVVADKCSKVEVKTTVTIKESDPLKVDAGGPYNETVCPGTAATIAFDSTIISGTGPFTYAWDFGDGGTSDLEDPSHTYPVGADEYKVTLVVADKCSKVEVKTTVTITEVKPPTADAGPDQCIQLGCESEVIVDFDGSGSSGACLTYDWDFDDGTYGTGSNPSHTYPAGTYDVTLTVTDMCGTSDTDTMVLTIHSSCGNLPDQLTISYSNTATNHYLKVKFSDGGGDILPDYLYRGWCAHRYEQGLPISGDVMYAYCTLELDKYWDKINYIINNRDGYGKNAVQWAIWHYIHNIDPGSSNPVVNAKAWELIDDADANGIGFCPGIGEKYVVLLTFFEIDTYGDLYKCHHEQNIMIEVDLVDHCLLQDI